VDELMLLSCFPVLVIGETLAICRGCPEYA